MSDSTAQRTLAAQRIVIDASALIAASISSKGASRELYRLATEGRVVLILCDYTIHEVRYNLKKQNYTRALIWFDISLAALQYEHAPNPSRNKVKRSLSLIKDDPNDVPYLVLAKETGADYIVAFDHHLLDLGQYSLKDRQILIMKPGDCLKIIRAAF